MLVIPSVASREDSGSDFFCNRLFRITCIGCHCLQSLHQLVLKSRTNFSSSKPSMMNRTLSGWEKMPSIGSADPGQSLERSPTKLISVILFMSQPSRKMMNVNFSSHKFPSTHSSITFLRRVVFQFLENLARPR